MAREIVVLGVADGAVLALLQLQLHKEGFRVLTASTGARALQIAADEHPSVVVVDVVPPELNALKLILQCRDRISAPILLVTDRRGWDSVSGFEIGADGYFARQFGPGELGARIRETVRRNAPREHSIKRRSGPENQRHNASTGPHG